VFTPRARLVLAFVVVSAFVASTVQDVGAATATFGPITVVNAQDFGGEPGIDVDTTGYLYENAPSGSGASWVYRSGDDGSTWTRVPGPVAPAGGFDSNGATDACNTYYMSDLYIGNVTVHRTKDRGATWTSQPITMVVPAGDRQWVDTGPGCGTVYESWDNLATGIWVAKSTDGGVTFAQQTKVAANLDIIGNLAVDKASGTVYQAYASGGFQLAISRTGGTTWTTTTVFSAPNNVSLSDSFPVVTVDRAGNVYAVWEQKTTTGKGKTAVKQFDIFYAYSTNGGQSFSAPVLIQSGSAGSNIFPWAVGGGAGHLDIVWYRAPSGKSDPNNNTGPWFVDFAQSLTATTGTGFSKTHATPVSIHNDVICTGGTSCSGASRDLLDFFEIATKPDGLAVISFALDTTNAVAGTGNGDPRNAFIKQTGGDPA
jgi:hypothetical protein